MGLVNHNYINWDNSFLFVYLIWKHSVNTLLKKRSGTVLRI